MFNQKQVKKQGSQKGNTQRIDHNQLWLECAKRGLSSDPLIQSALQQLSINPTDYECAQIIQDRIRSLEVRDLLHPDPYRDSNPKGSALSGSVKLGNILHTGAIWGIVPAALTEHVCIVGRTGGGKTILIKLILRQLLKRRK